MEQESATVPILAIWMVLVERGICNEEDVRVWIEKAEETFREFNKINPPASDQSEIEELVESNIQCPRDDEEEYATMEGWAIQGRKENGEWLSKQMTFNSESAADSWKNELDTSGGWEFRVVHRRIFEYDQ
jgi:hypothetical protein